eukprot:6255312-Pyramimonas_sp.AAC.1
MGATSAMLPLRVVTVPEVPCPEKEGPVDVPPPRSSVSGWSLPRTGAVCGSPSLTQKAARANPNPCLMAHLLDCRISWP